MRMGDEMRHTVGQVIYVVLKKELRVYPMQVIEEITKKTLEGDTVSYMVRGGTDPKAQLLISEVDGEIFDSAEKAKAILVERATESIMRLVSNAVQKAQEWYPGSFEAPSDDPLVLLKKSSGLGQVSQPSLRKAPRKAKSEVNDLAAEFQREADEASDRDAPLVTLPDGSKAKVRGIKLPDTLQ